jgi:hopanoid biosynthesis associated protein HpnK
VTKHVIITGDDFGLALPVNEAIEEAYRSGVLSTTSLLVGERCAPDAVERAHRNPGLRVGLHLALCEGRPTLPPERIPALVDSRGEFLSPFLAFARLLFGGVHTRLQVEAEIRAQLVAFRATGLELDHVNGHNNLQLHPVVLPILARVAREHGVRAVRLPYEPLLPSWRAARRGLGLRAAGSLAMKPWSAYVRRRLERAGLRVNDYLFGMYDVGDMDATLLARFIAELPEGVSEIHCHPASRRCPEIDRVMPHYRHEAELAALTSQDVRAALSAAGVVALAGFGALPSSRLDPGALKS